MALKNYDSLKTNPMRDHTISKKNCNHPKCTYCDLQPSVWCMYLTALKKII